MKDVMMAFGGGLNHGLKFREAKEAGRIGLKQLVAEGFGRKWYSVGVVEQDGVGVRILRVGDQRCRLFEMVFRCQRSEEHTSELQSHVNLVCRLLLEKKK